MSVMFGPSGIFNLYCDVIISVMLCDLMGKLETVLSWNNYSHLENNSTAKYLIYLKEL